MNAYLNYLMEANIGLCLFIVVYALLLRYETDFRIKRVYLLSGILASVGFPLLHVDSGSTIIPSLSAVIPAYWLPEFVVYGSGSKTAAIQGSASESFTAWQYIFIVYGCGVVSMLLIFLIRLISIIRKVVKSGFYQIERYRIIESEVNQSSFSFFRYIFIGQANQLSPQEKQQIVKHELVHASQYHSFDILLLNILNVFFWFNPILTVYKRTFVQLHEFEADARAVEDSDPNEYCSLLARVALLSADFRLANHFSNSLTVKRIEMMRTIKTKITRWKLVALAIVIPVFFFIAACQDQVTNDIVEIAKNSSHPLVVPEAVQTRYDQLKTENPNSNYILVEFNEKAEKQLAEMETTYGLPKSIELYTPDKGEWVKGTAASGVVIERSNQKASDLKTFGIIEYTEQMKEISERSKLDGEVFTVVEKKPEYFENGFNGLGEFLGSELNYPKEAKEAGIEGAVFISFIVETDGSVSDAKVMKSVEPSLDAEALRVVKMTKWIPGKQDGKTVRVQFVLPIKFKLS